MSGDPYLRTLHTRFSVSEPELDAFVRSAVGIPARCERVVDGYDNEVYRIRLDSGAVVYVRIQVGSEGDFSYEIWAMEQARKAGAPVPAVLAVGSIGSRPAMVVAAAHGRPLIEWLDGALTPQRRAVVLESIGRTLRVVNSIPVPGYGRPDDVGKWGRDAAAAHNSFVADRAADRDHLLAAGVSSQEIDQMIAAISDPRAVPSGKPVLCHGDPGPRHIYLNAAGDVVGLMDWGMWCGGSPVDDLANVAHTYPRDDLIAVVGGYGGGAAAYPLFRDAVWRRAIGQSIRLVASLVRMGDQAGTERKARALRTALRELSQPSPS